MVRAAERIRGQGGDWKDGFRMGFQRDSEFGPKVLEVYMTFDTFEFVTAVILNQKYRINRINTD